jgi:hypothetical protein
MVERLRIGADAQPDVVQHGASVSSRLFRHAAQFDVPVGEDGHRNRLFRQAHFRSRRNRFKMGTEPSHAEQLPSQVRRPLMPAVQAAVRHQ